jgi:hypothetical protein
VAVHASLASLGIALLLATSATAAAPASLHYRVELDGQPIGESGENTEDRGNHLITMTWYRAHIATPVSINFDAKDTYDESLDGQLIGVHSEYRENKMLHRTDIEVGADHLLRIRHVPGEATKPAPLDAREPPLGPQGVRRAIARWLKKPSIALSYFTIHSPAHQVHVSLEDLGTGSVPGSHLIRETWRENSQVWNKVIDADGTLLEERTDGPGGHFVTRIVP